MGGGGGGMLVIVLPTRLTTSISPCHYDHRLFLIPFGGSFRTNDLCIGYERPPSIGLVGVTGIAEMA